jgi:hypothetical protein
MKKPISRRSMQREYKQCNVILANGRDLTDYDRGILYGGRQAMGWALGDNIARPSACVSTRRELRAREI